jgi:general secretion pathway protein L
LIDRESLMHLVRSDIDMGALTDILSSDLSVKRLWARLPAAWRGFAGWWRSELLALLPASLFACLRGSAGPVIRLGVESDGVRVEGVLAAGRVAHGETMAWPDYSVSALDRRLSGMGLKRSDGIIGVVLPPGSFFCRSFEIPLRARERVHAIARQELEHRTPFQAESVYFGMVVEPQQDHSETLTIRQTIVRRDVVDTAVRRLDLPLAGISFVAPATGDAASLAGPVSLRPEPDRAVPFTRRLLHMATVVAVILAGADAALFWWRQERTITAIEAQIAVVREQARTVRGLEQEIDRIRLALRTLEEQRVSLSTADLWRETSHLLPDHSWATDWRFRAGSVSIAGFSAATTELVGLFETSPAFTQARLDAPITFDAANARERFSLVVQARADATPGNHATSSNHRVPRVPRS